jgi:hypothetical protein
MMLRITNKIYKIADKVFKGMLLTGAFPECHYSKGDVFESYSLFEYANTHSKFMKILDKRMKVELDPDLGVFTRKSNKIFLAKVEELAKDITEADMIGTTDRFHTIADSIMESME